MINKEDLIKKVKIYNKFFNPETLIKAYKFALKAQEAGVDAVLDHCGSMVGMFFTTGPVNNYADVQRADTEMFKRYFRGMLDAGIYIAPSAFEVGFLSTAHTQEIVEETVASASCVLSQL